MLLHIYNLKINNSPYTLFGYAILYIQTKSETTKHVIFHFIIFKSFT